MQRIFLTFAIVLAVAGCSTAGGAAMAGGRGQTDAAKGGETAASISPQPSAARPVWINSLHMISVTTGWALISTSNPNSSSALSVARTSDGGRTWDAVSPSAGRADFSAGQARLDAVSAERAWVVGVTGRASVVFGTVDGGRTWSKSGLIAGAEPVAIAFAGGQGWLLESMGAAMSQNPVRLYRSSDGGRSWSLAAQSAQVPGGPPNASGLPVACDKTNVAASPVGAGSPASIGWITAFCPASLTDAVLVSRDGGAHWASPPLPIPPSACQQSGCEIAGPQFVGPSTFLVIWAYPDQALLLSTTNGGTAWRTVILPAGAGPYPQVKFFDATDGIVVSAGSQGSIGRTFYLTTDGGRAWRPVVQGRRFGGSGTSFDFLSPDVGFAWTTSQSPLIIRTSSSGRSWTTVVPSLG